MWLLFAALSCDDPPVATSLTSDERVNRVSMAIRGVRPSADELEVVRHGGDAALSALVDGWLASDAFGATIRDLHNELFLLRSDLVPMLPEEGPLVGTEVADRYASTTESALRLVEDIVLGGRPYTEIVTATDFRGDRILANVYGLEFDDDGEDLQAMTWMDGRPMAGVLSDSEMWRRHVSNGSNFHRGRAAMVAQALLCDDFEDRDVVVEGGVDLTNELLVAEMVATQPSCVGCHQTLDPLAGFFWGFKEQLMGLAVTQAYREGCHWPNDLELPPPDGGLPEDFCYPLRLFAPEHELGWMDWGLREPGYYGESASGLDELGKRIAEDPRFWDCTTRRFASFFRQQDIDELNVADVARWRKAYLDSGFDARELVRAVVLDAEFVDPGDGPLSWLAVRPEAHARAIEQLTGFRWRAAPADQGCLENCWRDVDLLTTDLYGFRAMAGGVDSTYVLRATNTMTPTRALVHMRAGYESAAYVVKADLAAAVGERRLLGDWETAAPPTLTRRTIASLYERILGERIDPDGAEADAAFALFDGTRDVSGPEAGWTLLTATLLRDARMEYY